MKAAVGEALGVGSGYYSRKLSDTSKGVLDSGKPVWQFHKWFPWNPKTRAEAVQLILESNSFANSEGEYATIQCTSCGSYHNQLDWVGDLCHDCKPEQPMPFKGKKVGVIKWDSPTAKPKPILVRKQGDIWPLPHVNAPFMSKQWAYQGSGKAPYVITHYQQKRDGAVTEDGWACSCMSFTRNVPRTPCKHILNVMLKEGMGSVKKSTAKLANVDDDKLAAFEKWQREEAERKKGKQPVTGEAKLNLFGSTGRKFR